MFLTSHVKTPLALRFVIALAIVGSLLAVGRSPAIASHNKANAYASLPTIQWNGMVGLTGWFPTLDPAQVTNSISQQIIYKIYRPPLELLPGAKYSPTGGLATLKVSKDGLTYTFTFHKGLKFSNGDPLTAVDMQFSLLRHLAHATASPTAPVRLFDIVGAAAYYAGTADSVPGIVLVNKYVLQLHTTHLNTAFPFSFAIYANQILDHKILAGKPSTANNNYLTNDCSANVGAGPFKFVCRNNNDDLSSFYAPGSTPQTTLVPNPYFYGKKPTYKLHMEAIKDVDTAYLDFRAGQLDVSPLPASAVASNKGKKGYFGFGSSLVNYLSPAADLPPFNNVHCRLAVAYAIDTDKINKTVLHGTQLTIHDMVPKGFLGYYSGKGEPSYNVKKAKAELAKCPGGIHGVKLTYSADPTSDLVYAGAIPSMLAAVGIDVTGQSVPPADAIKLSSQPQKASGTTLLADALGISSAAITCAYREVNPSTNTADWVSAKFTSLCTKAVSTFDLKKRAQLYIQAQHVCLQQACWITLGQPGNFAIAKPWLGGLQGDNYYGYIVGKNYNWANVTIAKH
jgi:ABC-type transport system substrate-binding protein